MSSSTSTEATRLLAELGHGDDSAAQRLLPMVYEELRALAGSYFQRQPADHTLQPTALVHEAFVRLVDQSGIQWQNRVHFIAVAATAMRQILTDHARRHNAAKRGGDWKQIQLDDAVRPTETHALDVIALDEVLTRLAELEPRKHRVVELRFFGGLAMAEVAEVLGVSMATVENDWRAARAWLNHELSKG